MKSWGGIMICAIRARRVDSGIDRRIPNGGWRGWEPIFAPKVEKIVWVTGANVTKLQSRLVGFESVQQVEKRESRS